MVSALMSIVHSMMQQKQWCLAQGNIPVSDHYSPKTRAASIYLYRPGTWIFLFQEMRGISTPYSAI